MAIPPYMTQPFSESHFLLIPSISMHFCESSALLVGKSFKRQLQNNSLLCEYLTLYQAVLHLLIKARKAPTSNQRLMLISTFFYFYLITIQRPSRLPPILSITPFSCKLAKDLSTVLFPIPHFSAIWAAVSSGDIKICPSTFLSDGFKPPFCQIWGCCTNHLKSKQH